MNRQCSRQGCAARAVVTVTWAISESMAVIGPLSPGPTRAGHDLCVEHAERFTVPKGWELVRLAEPAPLDPGPDEDDLMALADAVRAIGLADEPASAPDPDSVVEVGRRGHLRVLTDAERAGQ